MLDSMVTATLAIFLATQTGAFIFYAGQVSRALREHERRLDTTEAVAAKLAADMAYLRGKESIQS